MHPVKWRHLPTLINLFLMVGDGNRYYAPIPISGVSGEGFMHIGFVSGRKEFLDLFFFSAPSAVKRFGHLAKTCPGVPWICG